MGASMGLSGSDSSSNMLGAQSKSGQTGQNAGYNTSQQVFGNQANTLGDLYNILGAQAYAANSNAAALSPQLTQQALDQGRSATGAFNNLLGGGAYNGVNSAGLLNSSLTSTLNAPTNTQQLYASIMGGSGNPYVEAMNNSMGVQAQNAMNLMRSQNAAQAAGAGMGGSSRQGVADAIGARDINNTLLSNMATVGYNSFGQDLQNKLNIAQQADSNTLSRQQMLAQMLGNQNQTTQNALGMGGVMQGWNSNPITAGSGLQFTQNALGSMGSPIVLGSSSGNMNGFGNFNGFGMASAQGSGSSKGFSGAAKA